ncbi:hypothetical protein [uncultured Nostoc sp.]
MHSPKIEQFIGGNIRCLFDKVSKTVIIIPQGEWTKWQFFADFF